MRTKMNNRINRIEYIVRENPYGVQKLLKNNGITIPNDLIGLISTTKKWVRSNGKQAVIELLKVHPEKSAILQANGHQEYDYYGGSSCNCNTSSFNGSCGCSSNFWNSSKKRVVKNLPKNTPLEKLVNHYETLRDQSNSYPNDNDLKQELEDTWEQVRKSMKEKLVDPLDKKKECNCSGKGISPKKDHLLSRTQLATAILVLSIVLFITASKIKA